MITTDDLSNTFALPQELITTNISVVYDKSSIPYRKAFPSCSIDNTRFIIEGTCWKKPL